MARTKSVIQPEAMHFNRVAGAVLVLVGDHRIAGFGLRQSTVPVNVSVVSDSHDGSGEPVGRNLHRLTS
jgi:hypothetical protein